MKPRWVVEGRLAVSPMPRPDDLEEVLSKFRTVVSLASPSEHAFSGGYDPRLLQGMGGVKFVWRPIGEYNAPTLVELSYIIESIEEPALVHCLRGCGRSSTVAAAWLVAKMGVRPYLAAESEVVRTTGCGLETLPQRSVLEAYSLAVRSGTASELSRSRDIDDPFPEYAALLSLSLSSYLGAEPEELFRSALELDTSLARAARLLADIAGYTVAGMAARKAGKKVALELTIWVPRRSHPAAIRRIPQVDHGKLSKGLASILATMGVDVEPVVRVRKPEDVPWLS
ncbi:hypothetical protein CF15_00560 [Pyrodictium occultum]|uniref:Swiss Army Knife protein DSP-PTPase phosphatase domain-containing protein n=1 Tax=Pyrodictium occultum TaxID=2309 RepID=A0A0V8RTH9_PYROC|nr:hypothetical protein CF15_00560 [Pyrodictium occultum]